MAPKPPKTPFYPEDEPDERDVVPDELVEYDHINILPDPETEEERHG